MGKTKTLLLVLAIACCGKIPSSPSFSVPMIAARVTRLDRLSPSVVEHQLPNQLLLAGVDALGITSLGLLVSVLSGKNRQQLEANLRHTEKLLTNGENQKFQPIPNNGTNKSTHQDFQLVTRDLVESYHTQALAQATSQYWFSVIAASFGFGIIIYALVGQLHSPQPQTALLHVIPGLAIEGVAVLFLTQADGTRKRATELYDRLRSDEKQLNVIALIESIEDGKLRDIVKAQLALQLVGIVPQIPSFSQSYPISPSKTPPVVDLVEMTEQTMLNENQWK